MVASAVALPIFAGEFETAMPVRMRQKSFEESTLLSLLPRIVQILISI